MAENNPQWLKWAQKIDSLAQAGLSYTNNAFDIERYHALREVAAEIISHYGEIEMPVIRNLLDAQAGYTTPKVDVRGVIFQDHKILLVKELFDGCWTLPGGWVDVNESPAPAAEREVWEESGYQVRAVKLLAVYDHQKHGHPSYIHHIYKLFFLCELLGGTPTQSIETGGAEFFAEDQIPPLSIARTTQEELTRLFEHHRNPDLPTDFD